MDVYSGRPRALLCVWHLGCQALILARCRDLDIPAAAHASREGQSILLFGESRGDKVVFDIPLVNRSVVDYRGAVFSILGKPALVIVVIVAAAEQQQEHGKS